ncbi:EamA family transporter [Pontibacter sp. G13]|uniref:EamA family transporter n=1 Tax=Pontibacter sp. G13 TaxID=3074898 RepID=UPI00288AFAD2|nr:EamA family transporter [Pontibacter sp. G13]WNJ19773.1 EamA family transporter [Pontibacter sp. G13]
MNRQDQMMESAEKPRSDFYLGLLYLGVDILISVAAQFVLKYAMNGLGEFPTGADADVLGYFWNMVNLPIFIGLGLYGVGQVVWLLCLQKLDLSFAYPVATLQHVLIFVGAWYLFDEQISFLRMVGLGIIMLGVILISTDKTAS